MTDENEVVVMLNRWVGLKDTRCGCFSHSIENKNVCAREIAWREYCKIRDFYIRESIDNRLPEMKDPLASFDA